MRLAVTCVYFSSRTLAAPRGQTQTEQHHQQSQSVVKLQWKEILPHSWTYLCKQAIEPAWLWYVLVVRIRKETEIGLQARTILFPPFDETLSLLAISPFILECGINDLSNLKTWFLVQCELYRFWKLVFFDYYVCFGVYASTFRNEWLGVVYARFPFFFLRLTQHTSISDQKTTSPHENN